MESKIKRGEGEIDLAARAGWVLVGCFECGRKGAGGQRIKAG
jgi:hypothetical protein